MMKQTQKVANLIEQNNQLQKSLIATNAQYYNDLLLYVRSAGIFYNDWEVETCLMEILQDIIA
ncbi:hypothetical protein EQ827_08475, partial [Lactobacillus bombi]|nr:hypothetical protein [Bombilactobacillus bombi]